MNKRLLLLLGAVALLFSAGNASAQSLPLLVIDEGSIDNGKEVFIELANNGICGGGDPAVCTNDNISDPGVRDPLNIPVGTIIGNGVPGGTVNPMLTGTISDPAWFFVPTIIQSWVDAGPTPDGERNYILALADGFGRNGEFLLDMIPDAFGLQTADLQALVGESFCAVVYDSDRSENCCPQNVNLQGATSGVISLKILHVGELAGNVLPHITVEVLDPGLCAAGVVQVEPASWGEVKSTYR